MSRILLHFDALDQLLPFPLDDKEAKWEGEDVHREEQPLPSVVPPPSFTARALSFCRRSRKTKERGECRENAYK